MLTATPLFSTVEFTVGTGWMIPALMTVTLPADYVEYLGWGSDVGVTSGLPGYFQLWNPDEIEETNRSYEVEEQAPGFLGFGSDGGGEMLAFDATGAVFMIPFVDLSVKSANRIAESWSEVAARITKPS